MAMEREGENLGMEKKIARCHLINGLGHHVYMLTWYVVPPGHTEYLLDRAFFS